MVALYDSNPRIHHAEEIVANVGGELIKVVIITPKVLPKPSKN